MRKLLAAITVVATLSAPLAAEASPWGWVEHHAHSIAQGTFGAVAVTVGLAAYVDVAAWGLGASLAADSTLALAGLAVGVGVVAPVALFGLALLGGYEIYQAVTAGSEAKGTDVRRNAETRALPQDRLSAPQTQNAGMHH